MDADPKKHDRPGTPARAFISTHDAIVPAMLRFGRTRRVLEQAIRDHVVPGAVVAVADEGAPVLLHAVGCAARMPRRVPATTATIYDLASLTKVLCTTTLAMIGVARGLLDLDARVATLVPEFAGPRKRQVRIRHLLAHSSGLPAHRRLYEEVWGREAVFDRAAAVPLEYPPGTRAIYSDLGFLVLGRALERSLGHRIDRLFAEWVARPLGLRLTRFVDLTRPGVRQGLLRRHVVAPTQLRGARVRLGAVDDDNAFAMGGIAPHAGLFSLAREVLAVGLALCRAHQHGELVPSLIVREFMRPAGIPGSTRALGWDTPSHGPSCSGERFPRPAVGHLGYTGGSIWLAPTRGLVVVLLTNRVHPTEQNLGIRTLRPAVHDAVMEDLG
jgi:CubicO group peptidase (beta-lactamase class C family)